jgi:predicted dehydrogenase
MTSVSVPIRLGAIGVGLAMEKLHWPALRRLTERFTITAFAEKDRGTAERFAAYSGAPLSAHHEDYRALLDRKDLDAVCILLPIPLLYDAARASLQAGKHVLCEKTPGTDLEQGRAFLQLEQEFSRQKLLIAENFFYRDDIRLARQLVDDGAIGQASVITWRSSGQYVPRESSFSSTPWRIRPGYRGGPHLDGGVHMISHIRMLCGDVRAVHALVRQDNTKMGGPSHMTLNLRFVSGAIGNYTALHPELPVPRDQGRGLWLYGTEGTMTFGGNPGDPTRSVTVHRPAGPEGKLVPEEHKVEKTDGGYYNEWRNFHDAIVHDSPIVGTVAQSFHNMLVVLRGLDSAESGGELDLTPDAPTPLSEKAIPLWQPHSAKDLFDTLPCTVSKGS